MAEGRVRQNGEDCFGSYCAICRRSTAGSGGQDPMKCIDGKAVCLRCYPQAVDIYLADVRLKGAEKNG